MHSAVWGIALASTLAWAAFDVVRKRLVRDVPVASLALLVSLAQVPFYLVWGSVVGLRLPGDGYYLPAVISVGLNLVANLFFLSSMKLLPLSQGIPLLSFTPVFVALSSMPLLGERLDWSQWAGVLLVTVGALGLTFPGGQRFSLRALASGFLLNRGALFMLAVAALWALAPIFDKLAVRRAEVPVHGLFLAVGVSLGMTVVLLRGRRVVSSFAAGRQALPLLFVGGGLNVVALGLQLVAISTLMVSVFEAFKRALGLLLALAFGGVFFGERLTVLRVVAGMVMAFGVLLVLI